MTASTNYVLNGALDVPVSQLAGAPNRGKLSIVNLNLGIIVTVTAHHMTFGGEVFELPNAGDTLELPLDGIDHYLITASAYPASLLYVETAVPSILSTPQSFAGSAGGGATVNVETVGFAGVIRSSVVTVTAVAGAIPAALLANRRGAIVQASPNNTQVVYLGGAAVTADEAATGGLQLTAGQSVAVEVGGATLYAIRGAGVDQKLIIIEGS